MLKKICIRLFVLFFVLENFAYTQIILKDIKHPSQDETGIYFSNNWDFYYMKNSNLFSRYSTPSGDTINQYFFPGDYISSIYITKNGNFFAIGGSLWWSQVWNLRDNSKLIEIQIYPNKPGDKWTDKIQNISLSEDGRYLQANGYFYHEYRCYSIKKGRNIILSHSLQGYEQPYHTFKNPLILLPQEIAIWDIQLLDNVEASGLYFVDLKNETLLGKIGNGISGIICVQGNYALTWAISSGYQFWDISGGNHWKLISKFDAPLESRNYNISQGGHYIYCSAETYNEKRPGKVLNALNGQVLWQLDTNEFLDVEGKPSKGLIFDISEDGKQLLGMDKTGMHIWDITNLKAMAEGSSTY